MPLQSFSRSWWRLSCTFWWFVYLVCAYSGSLTESQAPGYQGPCLPLSESSSLADTQEVFSVWWITLYFYSAHTSPVNVCVCVRTHWSIYQTEKNGHHKTTQIACSWMDSESFEKCAINLYSKNIHQVCRVLLWNVKRKKPSSSKCSRISAFGRVHGWRFLEKVFW